MEQRRMHDKDDWKAFLVWSVIGFGCMYILFTLILWSI